MHEGRCHAPPPFGPRLPQPVLLSYPSPLYSTLSLLSQEPRKKKVLPKLLSQGSTLEAIGDHGSPLLLLLGQEGARGPISLPFDFHHLGAALSTSSTLGEPEIVCGYFYPAEGGDGQE
ncbi:hypothetical protein U9M48_036036 [Paspalum notatum var. saurae]|uniref:Uncharacterized protein n=1 Tax=Paspalum notatum var. saurae TaxID=547442 RepID=A0AAQ3UGE9_PASNO